VKARDPRRSPQANHKPPGPKGEEMNCEPGSAQRTARPHKPASRCGAAKATETSFRRPAPGALDLVLCFTFYPQRAFRAKESEGARPPHVPYFL
jgi:hypothetical protein